MKLSSALNLFIKGLAVDLFLFSVPQYTYSIVTINIGIYPQYLYIYFTFVYKADFKNILDSEQSTQF